MINIQLDDELHVANYVIVIHIQNRGKNVTDLTNLLDHYFLHYLPFSPPSFCPLLYLSLLLSVPVFAHFPPVYPLHSLCHLFFYNTSFALAEED